MADAIEGGEIIINVAELTDATTTKQQRAALIDLSVSLVNAAGAAGLFTVPGLNALLSVGIGAFSVSNAYLFIAWTAQTERYTKFQLTVPSSSGLPCPGTPTVTYSGKTYNTVQIGTQCWLKENLDVGTRIDGTQEQTNNSTIEKYCYNNDPNNCNTYGGLYQWNEAMQYSTTEGARGICPSGWHIPTRTEVGTLSATVSADGNALKEIGQGTGLGAGTNTSGFSALLSGNRDFNGAFGYLGYYTYFWNSKWYTPNAYVMALNYGRGNISFSKDDLYYGYSVRCLKD
jgi:uncharacterized protein (TIGR02145 family)